MHYVTAFSREVILTSTFTLPAELSARVDKLPPSISVSQISLFFQKPSPTVRKQVRRGTFPVRVDQIPGGQQYILLTNLIKFLIDGQPQPQPKIVLRAARNPYGRKGKQGRGRPSHQEVAARKATLTIKRGIE